MKSRKPHTPSNNTKPAHQGMAARHASVHEQPWVIEALPQTDAVRVFAAWQTMGEVFSRSQPPCLPVIR